SKTPKTKAAPMKNTRTHSTRNEGRGSSAFGSGRQGGAGSASASFWSKNWIWLAAAVVGGLLLIAIAAFALFGAGGGSGNLEWGRGCVAQIDLRGEIMADDTPDTLFAAGQAGSETIAKMVEEADRRSDVKAILLEVDSPGGSPVGSRDIYRALAESKKPKVAYFREMAASGGYYAAMGTDYIVSEPDALTGSIGVRASIADLSGLFAKIGYNETEITSGELKDIGNPARPMTEQERAIMQAIVNESFVEFRDVVLQSRGARLRHPQFEQILDARVLSGRQALPIGLVDALGSRKDAILKASQMANETDALEVCQMQPSAGGGWLSRVLGGALAGPLLPRLQGGWQLQY
ncbi:MAG: signal peptide peptidase SppA, partial [Candidatus Marsarchaeota archaeon]|nr:signal peptide peptidase SppA [Candidatus Marsarchaeota archaeon]